MLPAHLGDDVLGGTLGHWQHPGLKCVPEVLGLDDGVGFIVEDLLDVVEHRARSTAAWGGSGSRAVLSDSEQIFDDEPDAVVEAKNLAHALQSLSLIHIPELKTPY